MNDTASAPADPAGSRNWSTGALRRLVQARACPALVVDARGVIRASNPAMEALLACSEPVGRRFVSFVARAQHERTERLLLAAAEFRCSAVLELATEPPVALPVCAQAVGWLDGWALLIEVEGGEELRELRIDLAHERDRREQLELALDAAQIGVWWANPDSGEMHSDALAKRLHGLPDDAALNHQIGLELVHPDDRAGVAAALAATIEQGKDFDSRHRTLRADGSVRWMESRGRWLAATATRPARLLGVVQDVTARMQAEAALRERELALHVVLANAQISVFEQDLDLRYVWVLNSRLGFSEKFSLAGQSDADIMSPEVVDALVAVKRRVIETGQPAREELLAGRTGQTLRYFELYLEPRRSADGRVIGLIGAATDIDERKRRERDLLAIFSGSPAAIGISRASDGIFIEANDAFLAIHGYSRDELIGHSSAELGLWPIPEQREAVFARLRSEGHVHAFVSDYRTKTGEFGKVLGSVDIIELGGEPHVLGVLTDISALDRAQQAVAASERLYHSLFDNMLHGLAYCRVVFDGDRLVDWLHLEINPALVRLTGIDGARGRYVSEVLPDVAEVYPGLTETLARVVRTGHAEQFEIQLAGHERWLHVSVYSPGPEHFVALVDDVTERRRTQRQLEAANESLALRTREAEEANLAKSRFLSSVSHELRTPLHTLLGYLRLVARSTRGDELRHVLAAERGALQLQRLIQDLLSFSLDPASVGTLDVVPTDVPHLLSQVEDFGLHVAALNDNSFQLVSDPALPSVVRVDGQRLSQVLHNLVDNACKYTVGGRVTLRVERVEAGSQASSAATAGLRFVVEDTGPGIPVQDQERIFDAFQRGSRVHLQPGMGLGLAIARHWVDAMGGTLGVTSSPGLGSCFHFILNLPLPGGTELPMVDDPMCCESDEHRQLAATRHLLVLDDLADNREFLRDLCRGWGYGVVEASDVEGALACIERARPRIDAVLVDQFMPVSDGWHFLRSVRSSATIARLPLVLVSASAPLVPADLPPDWRFDLVLGRPFDPQSLGCFLCRVLLPPLADRALHGLTRCSAVTVPIARAAPEVALGDVDRGDFVAMVKSGRLPSLAEWAADLARRDPACAPWAAEVMSCCETVDLARLGILAQAVSGGGASPRQG